MIKLFFYTVLAACMIEPSAFADTLLDQANALAAAVQKNEKKDTGQLNHYIAIWNQKCGRLNSDKLCMITEDQLLGAKGRKDHVLLFRGESRKELTGDL